MMRCNPGATLSSSALDFGSKAKEMAGGNWAKAGNWMGAGIGSIIGDRLKLDPGMRRILILAGAGAGIGAIFRSPLGGALTQVPGGEQVRLGVAPRTAPTNRIYLKGPRTPGG